MRNVAPNVAYYYTAKSGAIVALPFTNILLSAGTVNREVQRGNPGRPGWQFAETESERWSDYSNWALRLGSSRLQSRCVAPAYQGSNERRCATRAYTHAACLRKLALSEETTTRRRRGKKSAAEARSSPSPTSISVRDHTTTAAPAFPPFLSSTVRGAYPPGYTTTYDVSTVTARQDKSLLYRARPCLAPLTSDGGRRRSRTGLQQQARPPH